MFSLVNCICESYTVYFVYKFRMDTQRNPLLICQVKNLLSVSSAKEGPGFVMKAKISTRSQQMESVNTVVSRFG